jgi:hypothetical protein
MSLIASSAQQLVMGSIEHQDVWFEEWLAPSQAGQSSQYPTTYARAVMNLSICHTGMS